MSDSTESHTALTLPSELATVDRVEELALRLAREAGFDEDTASNIAMVAREAAVNAVIHGNRRDSGKSVRADFALDPVRLTICIADEGEGFDPDSVPDPLKPENLLRTSGRGIFLMKAFMDEVHLRQLAPGTEITLVKHRPAAAPPA